MMNVKLGNRLKVRFLKYIKKNFLDLTFVSSLVSIFKVKQFAPDDEFRTFDLS